MVKTSDFVIRKMDAEEEAKGEKRVQMKSSPLPSYLINQ